MKKWAKNPWVLGIGTTVIGGVLLSLLLDWIQGIDWLSTFKNIMRFIFNGVVSFLNFEIKVWWLLIAIAIIVVGLFVVAKISGSQSNNIPHTFLQYTKDYMLGYSWEWTYSKMYDGKYTISNLHPVCTKCGMRLKQGGLYGTEMECLRCNTTQNWEDSVAYDAQLLIEDNIRKNYSQNQ